MRQLGKRGLAWQRTRRLWIKQHPPNFQGYYECSLCGKWIITQDMQLDHIKKRGSHPELLHDFDNLRPVCMKCHQIIT